MPDLTTTQTFTAEIAVPAEIVVSVYTTPERVATAHIVARSAVSAQAARDALIDFAESILLAVEGPDTLGE